MFRVEGRDCEEAKNDYLSLPGSHVTKSEDIDDYCSLKKNKKKDGSIKEVHWTKQEYIQDI